MAVAQPMRCGRRQPYRSLQGTPWDRDRRVSDSSSINTVVGVAIQECQRATYAIKSVTNRVRVSRGETRVDPKSIQLRHHPHVPMLLKGTIGTHVKELVFAGRLESDGALCAVLAT